MFFLDFIGSTCDNFGKHAKWCAGLAAAAKQGGTFVRIVILVVDVNSMMSVVVSVYSEFVNFEAA